MAAVAIQKQLKDDWAGFQNLISSNSTPSRIQTILEQNDVLTEQLRHLEITYRRNFAEGHAALENHEAERQAHEKTIGELELVKNDKANTENNLATAKEILKQKIGEIGKLENGMSEMQAIVDKLKTAVRKHEEVGVQYKTVHQADLHRIHDVKSELDSVKTQMKSAQDRLDSLGKFAISLQPFHPEAVVKRLDDILKSAHQLAVTHFNVDLPTSILDNKDAWKAVRAAVKHTVPSSNTQSAKRMRGAAFLAFLGRELSEQIFRPASFVSNDSPLAQVMRDLADEDPAREAYLRSVLLAVQPDEQRNSSQLHVQTVVNKVLSCFQFLVLGKNREVFKLELEKVCRDACEHWSHLKQLQRVCRPDDSVFGQGEDDWTVVPWPTDEPKIATGSHINGKAGNGTSSKANGKGEQVNGKPSGNSPASAEAPAALTDLDVAHAVWPYFLSDSETVLQKGWCLTKAQVGEAEAEDPATHRGTRRYQRGRAASVSTNGSALPMSFLAAGSGGGANGA